MTVVSKQTAREIFARVVDEIDVERVMKRKLRWEHEQLWVEREAIDLKPFEQVMVVSFGKAAVAMARALDDLVPDDRRRTAIVVSPPVRRAAESPLAGWRCFVAGHPYPNEQSALAADAILELLAKADERTLVLFLISGGGSALVEKPIEPIPFDELIETHRVLVTSGASIEEMNVIRKHLSAVKGGRLAAAAHPAALVTLLISDVPEHAVSTIASGPTIPDESTVEDCYRIAQRRGLVERLPARVREMFLKRTIRETPKPGDAAFARSRQFVLLSSREAVDAALVAAREKGFVAEVDNSVDDWQLPKAADQLLHRVGEWRARSPGRPVCLISAGELSCPVTGPGQGGRNQAFVLYCVSRMAGLPVVVLSAGTDGIDGNSPAAGAVADGESLDRARAAGLDPRVYFDTSDSYHFFKALGDTLTTGPTGNNLRDLRLLLAE